MPDKPIRYVDDTIMINDTLEGLETLVNRVIIKIIIFIS